MTFQSFSSLIVGVPITEQLPLSELPKMCLIL